MDEDEAYPSGKIRLYPCEICGRNFNQESLGRHKNVCKKTAKKERKIFDSGRQRAEGSDVIYSKTKETKKVQILGEKPENVQTRNNWREKHNEFIKNVRQARHMSEAIKTGAPLPKFEPSAVPSDYVNCQYCGRNFSRNAAERHIPFCETQNKRQKINNSANQKIKQNKFQAPLPGQRKQSSEVYGGNYAAEPVPAQQNGYGRGYPSGNKGYSSGNERKPIRYDSNFNYESDTQDSGGSYANRNKAIVSKTKQQQEQMLRTGRNTTNSELNALARNRGGTSNQKESSMNRRPPQQQQQQQQQQHQQTYSQNGSRATAPSYGRVVPQQNGGSGDQVGSSKFCHECGSEFPVQWARFCSFCGDRRL